MPRQSISDITPPKRTIRDIPVPEHRKVGRGVTRVEDISSSNTPIIPPPITPFSEMKRSRSFKIPRLITIIVGLFIIGLLGLLASHYFKVQAIVTVAEKQKIVSVDGTFIGKKDAKDGELPFETVSVSKEDSRVVPATGEKQVETRASGTITIFNNYSTASQRLITNTRFETPEGRIYRIDKPVIIPGKNKGTGLPGSVDVVVYADTAGKEYNIGLSDFVIPGFKGDPRYSTFYARSKTSMEGGFIGKIKTASPKDLKVAKEELQATLKTELQKMIEVQVPQGFILFPGAFYVEFETLSPPDSNEIRGKATGYGVLLNRKKIAQSIALLTVEGYGVDSRVRGENIETLDFTPIPADAKPWQTGVVSFSLKGATTLIWLFDESKLKEDLAGQLKEKGRIEMVLQAYENSIDGATIIVRPFWRSTLPEKPEDITVEIAGVKK